MVVRLKPETPTNAQTTKHRDDRQIDDARPIDPDRFYRKAEIIRRRFFGYGVSQFDEKIKKGELPPLISLSETGRASGLYGRIIINLQEELEAKAAAKRQRDR
jgi:hypothetical protein